MIKEYKDEYLDIIMKTIKCSKGNEMVNEEILKNTLFYEKDDDIAMISFEKFGRNALIRYFIFRKSIEYHIVLELMEALIEKAKENNIINLIAISSNEMKNLFLDLKFKEFDKTYFFIDELNILNTRYKNANIMICNLCNHLD